MSICSLAQQLMLLMFMQDVQVLHDADRCPEVRAYKALWAAKFQQLLQAAELLVSVSNERSHVFIELCCFPVSELCHHVA
jgi:phosphopantetheinyl transferase (holo-ACP synthase)